MELWKSFKNSFLINFSKNFPLKSFHYIEKSSNEELFYKFLNHFHVVNFSKKYFTIMTLFSATHLLMFEWTFVGSCLNAIIIRRGLFGCMRNCSMTKVFKITFAMYNPYSAHTVPLPIIFHIFAKPSQNMTISMDSHYYIFFSRREFKFLEQTVVMCWVWGWWWCCRVCS